MGRLADSAEGSSFNWQLNLLTEQLLGNLGESLLAQLALGWREPGDATGDTLAVTLFGISLINGQAFADSPGPLNLSFGEQHYQLEESGQRPSSAFTRHVDQVLYCPRASSGELAEKLTLTYQDGAGNSLSTQIYLPERLETGWRSCEACCATPRAPLPVPAVSTCACSTAPPSSASSNARSTGVKRRPRPTCTASYRPTWRSCHTFCGINRRQT